MPFSIAVCQYNAIRATAKRFGATHLVSLVDRGVHVRRPSRILAANHLLLFCTDIIDPMRPDAPQQDQIARLLTFGRSLTPDNRVLVHCEAGRRRSTAAALLLLAQALGPSSAHQAATLLVAARPQACPNALIVRLGADLLGQPDLVPVANQVSTQHVQRMIALGLD